jgi:hypothetical protein
MTDNRLPTAWLRSLAGLVALIGVLGLGACGGGSGAPNPISNPISTLTVQPAIANVYSQTPVMFTVAGGRPPYSLFSSDQSALPTPSTVTGNSVIFVPSIVNLDTTVTVTARDADGNTANSAVTVKPATLINSMTLKADGGSGTTANCPNPGGSSSATDSAGQTFICAGQTGSVAVRVGGGLAGGRQIRFDVVQGPFQLFTNGPGQPDTFALSYTVPTDQNGDAIARVRATPNANQQIVIVQATDLLTGTFVRGIFIVTNGDGLLIVPDTVNITGPTTETCSSGVITSFFIFGGAPPYTISNTFPQFLGVSPGVVNISGGGFNATTTGACLSPGIIGITDSAGHTKTVSITNALGSTPPATVTTNIPIVISPSTIPTLTCGASFNVFATGGGTTTQTGTTTTTTPATTLFVSSGRTDILSAVPLPVTVPPAATAAPGTPIQLTRLPAASTVTPPPSGATVNVTLTIGDGKQVVTKNVPVINTCP